MKTPIARHNLESPLSASRLPIKNVPTVKAPECLAPKEELLF